MHTIVRELLTPQDLSTIRDLAGQATFEDGRSTSEHESKRNLQVPLQSNEASAAGAVVVERLRESAAVRRVTLPVAIHPPLFSRYDAAMEYPEHIDASLMSGLRTDIAVTVFLSDLEDYDGGELVVRTGYGTRSYRLPAGDAIVYPASCVHRVAPVRRGSRFVAVLWVQSLVRDVMRRQVLADLDIVTESLQDTVCWPRLRRSHANLLRMWADATPGALA